MMRHRPSSALFPYTTLFRSFDTARTIVARYGGTVEKFIGDAVMAVWGAPVAREDDAERAVRAGLELVDAVAALDRKSTRLNSSHPSISSAVLCLKKKTRTHR